jgi:hypothetical protein
VRWGRHVTSPILVRFAELWEATRARLIASGDRLTLERVQAATGVPKATLSDWRRGHHAPREIDDLIKVVRVLSDWANLPAPDFHEWSQLVERARIPEPAYQTPQGRSLERDLPMQPPMVAIQDSLTSAFEAEDVEIDAICVTGDALALGIARPVQDIHAGRLRPRQIKVRILTANTDVSHPLPAPRQEEDAERVRQLRLRDRNVYVNTLRSALASLHGTHGIDVLVEFRGVPFTPLTELILLNGVEALFSYCKISSLSVADTSGGSMEVYDAVTYGSLMRRFKATSGYADRVFVDQSYRWFNSIWETVSTEVFSS